MDVSLLIAYATKHGSTKEVADRIAGICREEGARVDVLSAREVKRLDGYAAVVLGAPLYSGLWHRHGRSFLKRHKRVLATLPLSIFALGPRTREAEAWQRSRNQLEKALGKFPWLKPDSVELFGGVDPPKKRLHRDARDWNAIAEWARSIAARAESVLSERKVRDG